MNNVVIVGTQWGDEGKGKVVDLFSGMFDIVARYQGGHNAGHTVKVNGHQHVLHLIPSGIWRPGVRCVLGNGMAISPAAFNEELRQVHEHKDRIYISNRAHLIGPWHRAIEAADEKRRGAKAIGTTLRGIGPAYEWKYGRRGYQAVHALTIDEFEKMIFDDAGAINAVLTANGAESVSEEEFLKFILEAEQLQPFIRDTTVFLNAEIRQGKSVMFEGAQATMLDVDFGTYPFVTSSNPSAGGACTGTGVAPNLINCIVGIAKAYTTRVGAGSFPTELHDEIGHHLWEKGAEKGSSTGRDRRCGWFDAEVVRYSALINNPDALIITKLDILDELEEINICVGYLRDGQRVEEFPVRDSDLAHCEPIYETHSGWRENTAGITNWANLPAQAQRYLARIEELCERDIKCVSTGGNRHQTIIRKNVAKCGWMNDLVLESAT